MTNATTTARPEPAVQAVAADATAIDAAARGPLLLLLGSGLVWLVISGILALITSIQLHTPHFLSQYSFLTYGRVDALRETAFVYGWAANAGLAIALWVLSRLGGQPLRALNWIFAGAAFWNLGVTAGLVGIAIGDMTSFSLFQLPRYVQPLMVVAYGSIAVSGILAWSDRRNHGMFASQWYAVAALLLFPWLSSAAQLLLLWSPLRGVVQPVGAQWYAAGVWSLWLAPIALAAAYYIIPKVTGRTHPLYDFAPHAFWMLVFLGAWTGGRHLVGGPVPAWIPTVAVVAAVVLLMHYLLVAVNLRVVFEGRGTSIGFIRTGVIAYLLSGLLNAVASLRGVAVETQFTLFDVALEQLALYGGLTMIFFGAIYYMVPRLTGNAWTSFGLTIGHRVLATIGVVLLVVVLAVSGWTQGSDLLNPKVQFAEVIENARLSLLVISGAQLLLLFANILLLVNFFQTISATVVSDVTALSPIPRSTEESAS